MLKALITSKTRRKALSLLFMNPKKSFYLREICRKIGEPTNAVSAELANLEKHGLLSNSRKGNMLFFQANENCPIFNEIKSIIAKTEGLGSAIKSALISDKNIDFAFIYGSFAKGGERQGSDLDIMLIGSTSMQSMAKKIKRLENLYGREINLSIYPKKEFLKGIKKGFIQDVLKGKKIMLIGDENELERLAKG